MSVNSSQVFFFDRYEKKYLPSLIINSAHLSVPALLSHNRNAHWR